MLAIEIELLADRYVATDYTDRGRAEWPPHPARLFSALVAEWVAAGSDPEERATLEWLEALEAPHIACSDADERAPVTHYVPDNDVTVLRDARASYERILAAQRAASEAANDRTVATATQRLSRAKEKARADSRSLSAVTVRTGNVDAAIALLPDTRSRQARTYPTRIPADSKVYLIWPDAQPTAHIARLDRLLARVARVGHSSSMVSCRVVDDAPSPSYVPGGDSLALRTPARGLLAALEREFERHAGSEPRTLPARITPYGAAAETRQPSQPHLGGDWYVLAMPRDRRPAATRAVELSRAVRDALLSHADEPVPEVLSGHRPGPVGPTGPTTQPHVAVVPLPFVGRQYADGAVLGMAVILPTGIAGQERRAVLRALGRWRDDDQLVLRLGRGGIIVLHLADQADARLPFMLTRWAWCRPATRYASATPVALDRFPGDLRASEPRRRQEAERTAIQSIRQSCTNAGLSELESVEISLDTPLLGTRHLRSFPTYRTPSGTTKMIVHVRLSFVQPVAGPVLIGAGRYFGYGLCWPLSDGGIDG